MTMTTNGNAAWPEGSRERYEAGVTMADFVRGAQKNAELWRSLLARAVAPDDLVARARALSGSRHLLALTEDWCGDAVNTLPVVAKLADAVPQLELRALARDQHLDVMDAHLTNGTRSIPVVIVLDAEFRELGWWGPRPAELQRWALTEGQALAKEERYRAMRQWYARDRGRTTLEEIVALLERTSDPAASPARPTTLETVA